MKRLTQTLPLLLAAALQLLPLLRNLAANPATGTNLAAFILRWGLGITAAVESVDAVSGATSVFTTPSTFSGAVGTAFSQNVTVSISGGNTAVSSDYIFLSAGTTTSTLLMNGQSTTATLPPGLTFTASWVDGGSTIGGIITGTPTTAGSYPTSVTIVSPGNASLSQNITITISGSGTTTPTAPAITTPPAAANVIAGKTATFTVTASGTAPLGYFWRKNNSPLANGGNVSGANTATLTLAGVSATDAGSYSVLVSNSVGTATSAAAALTVILPPAISAQPAAQTVASGANASFSVTATGTAPLAYQWLKNGAAIANGTKYSGVATSALTVTAVAAADAGNFSVVVTNAAGSVTSSVAPLAIVTTPTLTAPTITTPPANLSVVAGANASFTVTAAGSTPLFYFWQKNNSPLANGGSISGVNTANLILSAVTTNDAGSYSVIVSNSLGTITSPAATLTVAVPPAIVTAPASATLTAGGNVTFTVTASGTAPLAYQWLKNNSAMAGATSATFTLNNVAAADAANYSVTVTNAVGSATSAAATLTVLGPPAITTAPASASVVQGNSVSFSAAASGTAPLSFQWLKNGVAIPGAISNVLTLSAVTTNDAANYSVVVTNIVGNIASSSATLTVLVPPTIVTPPASASVVAGNAATFTVTANGTAPLTYQWKKNGVNLAGATAATLNLNNISAADAASYSVVVANAAGSATSSAAALTVMLPPAIVTQPASQFGALGSTVNLSVVASGTGPLSYQWFQHGVALADGGNISGSATTNLTITALTTNEVDTYFVVVANAYGSVTSANAKISINATPIIIVPPASQNVAVSNTATFTVTAAGTGPLAYQWYKNGILLTNGTIIYRVTSTSVPPNRLPGGSPNPLPNLPPNGSPGVPPTTLPSTGATIAGATLPALVIANVSTNDNGNYSVIITNSYGSITSSIATLAVFTAPAISGQPTNQTLVVGASTTFAVTATGSGPLNFQWFKNGLPLADGGNISGAAANILKLSALATADAGNYSVRVGNLVGSVASSNATLTVLVPPAITAQPANQSVTLSNAATFSVSATGTAPLAYQWRKAGVAIAGATNTSYTIASVKTTDVAAYSVVITNLAGSVTSSNATLVVNLAPTFTVQATNRWAKAGTNTIFSAVVSGTAPLSYQWFKDGVALTNGSNISGSLSNVLTVASLTTNDSGAYFLKASNVAGSATSTNAVLTVVVPPAILTQPASQTAVVSNAVTFNVGITGTAPLFYQWRKGTTAIAGATNASLTLANVKTNDAGSFSVIVTNLAGSVTSSNATLAVFVPPTFLTQAASRTATNGTTTVFSATVRGTAPFQYQWFKNGSPLVNGGNISGSTSNVLTVSALTTKDAGNYSLAVTNFAGGIISSNAVLTVFVPTTGGGGGGGENDHVSILHHPKLNTSATVSAALPSLQISRAATARISPKASLPAAAGWTLTAAGTPGATYVLQASSDLTIWTGIATNAADASGVWQATDPESATVPARFYRLATP